MKYIYIEMTDEGDIYILTDAIFTATNENSISRVIDR